jgi:hypothetical protein
MKDLERDETGIAPGGFTARILDLKTLGFVTLQ